MKDKKFLVKITGYVFTAIIAAGIFYFAITFLFPGERSDSSALNERIDFIQLQEVARKNVETGVVDLKSLKRYYYLKNGWAAPEDETGDGVLSTAAVHKESVFLYTVVKPAHRWITFDIGLSGRYGVLESQEVELLVGDESLGSATIDKAGARELEFFIPTRLQKVGENEIRFRFKKYRKNETYLKSDSDYRDNPYPGLAGYFSNIKIYLGSRQRPWKNEIQEEEHVFRAMAGGKYLNQIPNSSISFGEKIQPESSRITFAGIAKSPPNKGVNLVITVRIRNSNYPEWQQLWSREFEFSQGATGRQFTGNVAVDGYSGVSEINFLVTADGRPSNLRVTWKKMALESAAAHGDAGAETANEDFHLDSSIKNVIIVVLDAARADHFGCYGNQEGMTPHIDEFAKHALLFHQAVTSASYTIASVATLFSGQQPETHGVSHGFAHTLTPYPEDLESMPKAFKRNGFYTLALSGNPFLNRSFGLTRDCDDMVYLLNPEDSAAGLSRMDMDRIKAAIEKAVSSGKPAFIYAHFLPPHWPYNPPQPFDKQFGNYRKARNLDRTRMKSLIGNGMLSVEDPESVAYHARYKNNLAYGDALTNEFFELLKKYGLYENSLVIVTADHGEEFGKHGFVEHGETVYDAAIHVPLIMRIPGRSSEQYDDEVGLIDIFPTLADMFNLELVDAQFEGQSLVPILLGEHGYSKDYYFSIASGHKLAYSMRGKVFKYIFHLYHEALYDVMSDPLEQKNIIDERPGLATWLRQRGMLKLRPYRGLAVRQGEEIKLDEQEKQDLRNLGYLQ